MRLQILTLVLLSRGIFALKCYQCDFRDPFSKKCVSSFSTVEECSKGQVCGFGKTIGFPQSTLNGCIDIKLCLGDSNCQFCESDLCNGEDTTPTESPGFQAFEMYKKPFTFLLNSFGADEKAEELEVLPKSSKSKETVVPEVKSPRIKLPLKPEVLQKVLLQQEQPEPPRARRLPQSGIFNIEPQPEQIEQPNGLYLSLDKPKRKPYDRSSFVQRIPRKKLFQKMLAATEGVEIQPETKQVVEDLQKPLQPASDVLSPPKLRNDLEKPALKNPNTSKEKILEKPAVQEVLKNHTKTTKEEIPKEHKMTPADLSLQKLETDERSEEILFSDEDRDESPTATKPLGLSALFANLNSFISQTEEANSNLRTQSTTEKPQPTTENIKKVIEKEIKSWEQQTDMIEKKIMNLTVTQKGLPVTEEKKLPNVVPVQQEKSLKEKKQDWKQQKNVKPIANLEKSQVFIEEKKEENQQSKWNQQKPRTNDTMKLEKEKDVLPTIKKNSEEAFVEETEEKLNVSLKEESPQKQEKNLKEVNLLKEEIKQKEKVKQKEWNQQKTRNQEGNSRVEENQESRKPKEENEQKKAIKPEQIENEKQLNEQKKENQSPLNEENDSHSVEEIEEVFLGEVDDKVSNKPKRNPAVSYPCPCMRMNSVQEPVNEAENSLETIEEVIVSEASSEGENQEERQDIIHSDQEQENMAQITTNQETNQGSVAKTEVKDAEKNHSNPIDSMQDQENSHQNVTTNQEMIQESPTEVEIKEAEIIKSDQIHDQKTSQNAAAKLNQDSPNQEAEINSNPVEKVTISMQDPPQNVSEAAKNQKTINSEQIMVEQSQNTQKNALDSKNLKKSDNGPKSTKTNEKSTETEIVKEVQTDSNPVEDSNQNQEKSQKNQELNQGSPTMKEAGVKDTLEDSMVPQEINQKSQEAEINSNHMESLVVEESQNIHHFANVLDSNIPKNPNNGPKPVKMNDKIQKLATTLKDEDEIIVIDETDDSTILTALPPQNNEDLTKTTSTTTQAPPASNIFPFPVMNIPGFMPFYLVPAPTTFENGYIFDNNNDSNCNNNNNCRK